MKYISLFSAVLWAAIAASAPASNEEARGRNRPIVSIDSGFVVGTTVTEPSSRNCVNKFLGIPFAAPPERFSLPQPASPWAEPLDASKFGSHCFQSFGPESDVRDMTELIFNHPAPPSEPSEDCLNLNVFAPDTEGSKAVLFWIYGGAFDFGASSLSYYDGTSFAANQDVVVVTFNYRTNIFGFPGSPEIPINQHNLGFYDQRLALDWVRRNIAVFGGDPERITIFGESAGSASVETFITNPPEPIPFQAAIMQSGQASINAPATLGNDGTAWATVTKAANCTTNNTVECVRAIPAKELINIVDKYNLDYESLFDNVTYSSNGRLSRLASTPENPLIARVPVLIGHNADEGSFYAHALGINDTASFLGAFLGESAPEEVLNQLLKAYPKGGPGLEAERKRSAAIIGDYAFGCPNAVVSKESSAVGIPTWRYYYNASFPNQDLIPGLGAFHSAEIVHAFGTYKKKNATRFQVKLSQSMQRAWADFAKDPLKGPGWQQYPKVAVLGDGIRIGDSGKGKTLIKEVEANTVDARCPLYQPFYDLITGVSQISG